MDLYFGSFGVLEIMVIVARGDMEITIVEIGRSTDCMFGVSIASFWRLIMRSSLVHRIASNALHFFTRPIIASQPAHLYYVARHALAIA